MTIFDKPRKKPTPIRRVFLTNTIDDPFVNGMEQTNAGGCPVKKSTKKEVKNMVVKTSKLEALKKETAELQDKVRWAAVDMVKSAARRGAAERQFKETTEQREYDKFLTEAGLFEVK